MLASPMLLEGSEWVIVVVIIGALLIFGPEKIPQMAKQIGRAKAEFDKASIEAKTMMDTAIKSIDQETSGATKSWDTAANDMKASLESTAREMKSSFDAVVSSARAPASAQTTGAASGIPPSSSASTSAVAEPQAAAPALTASEVDTDALLKLAHRMGIVTDGKTRDEISEEIFSKSGSEAKT